MTARSLVLLTVMLGFIDEEDYQTHEFPLTWYFVGAWDFWGSPSFFHGKIRIFLLVNCAVTGRELFLQQARFQLPGLFGLSLIEHLSFTALC